ncbi:hypothetical protein GCM10011517_13180 [Actibacterium pelagium]|uniref:Uncharacterized protein n=1 Tax=Actibacterium pelagium TaxID=2029103 RepID=A0A917EK14_9RHOB|nr:hypothetical protein GCM10011517_13180 [Actibacterium pelagium]
MDYFAFAQAGPYHPKQIMEDLKLDSQFWRRAAKDYIYPDNCLGRRALASVGVTICSDQHGVSQLGRPIIASIFVKAVDD